LRRSRMRRVSAVGLIVALAVAGSASANPAKRKPKKPNPAVVVTDRGVVRGVVSGGMRSFKGIPYAAPPVGPLRWKAPRPAAAWKGIRAATNFGSSCPQPVSPFGRQSSSEDCLYLNVFTPRPAGKGHAVMVWIHGGALIYGESNDYNAAALVKQGVVVVTINYRLGLLGFLAHPALSAESPTHSSGNYGLLDQQAALRWVKRNIARFGGNPGNVTIFGESAGGLSVRSQLVSPLARGLFDKAIIESGAVTETLPTEAQAEAIGQTFAAKVGCSDQSAACLRSVPVPSLLATLGTTSPVASPQLLNVDGTVLPAAYGAAFKSGSFNKVPVLSGSNHDEWRLFVALFADLSGNPVSLANYQTHIQSEFGVPAPVAALFASQYPPGSYPSPAIALGALGTDLVFACNARTDVRNLSQFVPTYQYEFNDPNAPPLLPAVSFPYGAYHAGEIQYLFPPAQSQLNATQQQLAAAMRKYWTQFAKTGDPNGRALPAWPKYASSTDQAQSLIPPTPTTESTFAIDHKCAFWETVTAGRVASKR
jgi:para-nitrobenzyl esterase